MTLPTGSAPRRHLVTGSGSGIGRVVAQRLVARGDSVWAIVRAPGRAPEGCVEILADLADVAALEALSGPRRPEWPERLDSVVHAAGVVELGPVAELGASAWQDQLAVNLVAPALVTRAALPALRAARGTVVFVNSGSGLRANPAWSAYAASKFGLRALADALRDEEPLLRVTSVFPGRTATVMQEKVHAQEGREYDAGRWIRPETVAGAILGAIDLSPDATMPEISIRPGG